MAMNDSAADPGRARPGSAAMSTDEARDQAYRLPCGHDLNTLWDNVSAGVLDEHEAGCADCRALAASVRGLRDVVAAMREPVAPPSGLSDRIMAVVRAERGRGDLLPLPSQHGSAQVSRAAVAVVLRYGADTVPGVRARDCRIDTVDVDPDGRAVVRVSLGLALAYGAGPAADTFAAVRRRVRAAADGQVGIRVGEIDLRVADVYDTEAPQAGGPTGREAR